jgi:hypothetical protein
MNEERLLNDLNVNVKVNAVVLICILDNADVMLVVATR